jgi:hypothetical protein
MTEAWRPRRAWRRSPYYKVQVYDERGKVWRDERGVYDAEDLARAHIREKLAGASARVMLVDGNTRHPLPD